MVFTPDNTIIDTLDVNILVGTSDSDQILGLGGDDLIFGEEADDQLFGNEGADTVYGHQENDIIYGGSGADFLFGGQGNDSIFGDEGNDTIYADQGADILTGGDGSDVFVLETGTGNFSTTTTDLIVDFNVDEDQIEFQDGLTFEDLSIEETPEGDTVIRDPNSEEILALLQGVNRDSFIEVVLPSIDISEETTVEEPIVTASLENDTGVDDRDNITTDPTLTGTVINGDEVAGLEVSIGEEFVSIETDIADDGSFTLTPEQLEEALDISFTNGVYTVQLQTVDSSGSQLSEPTELTLTIAPDDDPPEQEIEFFPPGTDFLQPTITAELANDNGTNDSDGITSDPTITGTATDNFGVAEIEVSMGGEFISVETNIAADGSFTLTQDQLEETLDSPLTDDTYTVFLRAVDTSGLRSLSLSEVTFTFDPTLVDNEQDTDTSDSGDNEQDTDTSDSGDSEQDTDTSDSGDSEQDTDTSDSGDSEQDTDTSDPVDNEQDSDSSDPVDNEQPVTEVISSSSAAIWTENLDDFTTTIQDLWDDGFDLVDVEYAEDTWFGSFQEDTGANAYSIATTGDEFQTQVQERWDDGFDLVDAEYGDGRWFLTFRGEIGANAYSIATTGDEFQTKVQEKWDDGFDLVDVEYAEDTWLMVFREYPGITGYVSAPSLDEFQTDIQEKWDDGFDLVDVEYVSDYWVGVFQEYSGRNGYTTATSLDEFQTNIQEKWDDGLDLVDVGYGDGIWFGVFQDEVTPPSGSSGGFSGNSLELINTLVVGETLLAVSSAPVLPI